MREQLRLIQIEAEFLGLSLDREEQVHPFEGLTRQLVAVLERRLEASTRMRPAADEDDARGKPVVARVPVTLQ